MPTPEEIAKREKFYNEVQEFFHSKLNELSSEVSVKVQFDATDERRIVEMNFNKNGNKQSITKGYE